MTEQRENFSYYGILFILLAAVVLVAFKAGAPSQPSMPGVNNPPAPQVVAPETKAVVVPETQPSATTPAAATTAAPAAAPAADEFK